MTTVYVHRRDGGAIASVHSEPMAGYAEEAIDSEAAEVQAIINPAPTAQQQIEAIERQYPVTQRMLRETILALASVFTQVAEQIPALAPAIAAAVGSVAVERATAAETLIQPLRGQ